MSPARVALDHLEVALRVLKEDRPIRWEFLDRLIERAWEEIC
jgi:hypothetical protein